MTSFLSVLSLFSGLCTVQLSNPVHSVLFLIGTFLSVSALLIAYSLEFFALTFIVVYVGAIAVLFLFVVMMLNLTVARRFTPVYLPLGLLLFFLVISSQISFITSDGAITYGSFQNWISSDQSSTTIEIIGQVLYTQYAVQFLLASLVLLVAMIGAILLTMLKSSTIRRQTVFEQNNRLLNRTAKKVVKITRPMSEVERSGL